MEKQNCSQKYSGSAQTGSLAAMVITMVLENEKNDFESILKTKKGEGVPPSGDISAMVADVVLKKQKTRYE